MGVKIITDSTSEIASDLARRWGIEVAPLQVFFGEECYRDGVDISIQEFYHKMASHTQLPTTSQVTPAHFLELFRREKNAGQEVVGIFISSELSGTYQSACMAREMLGEKGIYLIDSRTATFGLGAMALDAARRAEEGQTGEEIYTYLENIKNKTVFYGVIDSLDHLRRGGRLSPTSALVGNILGIKPVITIRNGEVMLISKARRHKKAFLWMLEDLQKNGFSLKGKTIYTGHSIYKEALIMMKEMIREQFEGVTFVDLEIGAVVGTHIGPGAVGFTCLE